MSVRESGRQDRAAVAIRTKYGKHAWVRVSHGSAYSTVGDPDLHGCVMGQCFGFEVKNDIGELTKIQIYRLYEMRTAGAITGGIREPEDALRLLYRGLTRKEKEP